MARRTRSEEPSLARTRSAAPAVGILLDYAAPELAAWVSAHREAVLRAAEAVDAAYVAEVDALAPLLPGGETVWERASASLTIYDSESEEHRAHKPTRAENVEGWQSRATDKHGKRSVIALLPVRLPSGHGFSTHLENRWVHGHGFDRAWTLTTVWPSALKPLELADYDARRMGVRVEDLENEEVQAERVPLDAAHEALFRWIRDIIAKSHSANRMPNILNPDVLRRMLLQSKMLGRVEGREGEADSIVSGVIRFDSPRNAPWETHSYLMNRKQVQAVQDRLLATGVIVYKRLDRFGKEVAASKEGKDYLFFSGEPYHLRLRREREEEKKREREEEETRRQGVDVSQQTGEEGGGGSTMPTDKKPVLDPIHQLVVEAFRLERRKPLPSAGADTRREVTKFNKTNVHWFLEQFFSPEAIKAVGEPTMMRRARKALLDGGDLALTGFLDEVRFTPAERLTQAEYGRQRRAMEARSNEAARLTREQTAVTQPTEGEGRGSDKPVLDPIHELVMEAYLLQAVRPQFSEGEDRYAGFSPGWVSGILRRSQFSDRAQAAVVHPSFPGVSIAPSLVRASQMKHIREALVNAGAVVPAERSGSGAVVGWRFAPATPLSPETYEQARAALAARAAALVADGTPLGDRLAFAERMRGARG